MKMNLYKITRGQLITLWVFGSILELFCWVSAIDYYESSKFAGLCAILIPALLIFYTLGWRKYRKQYNSQTTKTGFIKRSVFGFLKILRHNKIILIKISKLLGIIVTIVIVVYSGDFYFNKYLPAKNISEFKEKYTIENIKLPDSMDGFNRLLQEFDAEVQNLHQEGIFKLTRLLLRMNIERAFRDAFPEEAIKESFDEIFEKDNLSFQYPDYLKITEQDAEEFNGFYNYDAFLDEENVYGQIVVSLLDLLHNKVVQKEKMEEN